MWRDLRPGSRFVGFTDDDPIHLLARDLDFWMPPATEVMETELRTWPEIDKGVEPDSVTLDDGSGLGGTTAVTPWGGR